jgi:hypothetical protein
LVQGLEELNSSSFCLHIKIKWLILVKRKNNFNTKLTAEATGYGVSPKQIFTDQTRSRAEPAVARRLISRPRLVAIRTFDF